MASMEWIVDDIAEVLAVADVNQILWERTGRDPIVHFYEPFLAEYDPAERERRGVYYTPEPVVSYIVRSLHQVLQEVFGRREGFASTSVRVLDPAVGTCTFPAEAARMAVAEFAEKYGVGAQTSLIREHILRNFYAFELMMAPYAVGHLKLGFLLEELGYRLSKDERFQLYLTNTLEWKIEQTGEGVLGFITNHSYLDNPTFRGMRQSLIQSFEQIYVLNLHGNSLKKERCPDGSKDENVFDIITPKRVEFAGGWQHALATNLIAEHVAVSLKTIDYLFPLYFYPDIGKKDLISYLENAPSPPPSPPRGEGGFVRPSPQRGEGMGEGHRTPNLNPSLLRALQEAYGRDMTPEEIFSSIYAVLYAPTYRTKYAEFLKTDFPRVPFPRTWELFSEVAQLGKRLVNLHLLKSPDLDPPLARFQGTGENTVEKPRYHSPEKRVSINPTQYFEGVEPEVWSYRGRVREGVLGTVIALAVHFQILYSCIGGKQVCPLLRSLTISRWLSPARSGIRSP